MTPFSLADRLAGLRRIGFSFWVPAVPCLLAVLGCLTGPASGVDAEPLLKGRVRLASGVPASGAPYRH